MAMSPKSIRRLRPTTRLHAHFVRELTSLTRRSDNLTDAISTLESERHSLDSALTSALGINMKLREELAETHELLKQTRETLLKHMEENS